MAWEVIRKDLNFTLPRSHPTALQSTAVEVNLG